MKPKGESRGLMPKWTISNHCGDKGLLSLTISLKWQMLKRVLNTSIVLGSTTNKILGSPIANVPHPSVALGFSLHSILPFFMI